jgi:hypothetical protein
MCGSRCACCVQVDQIRAFYPVALHPVLPAAEAARRRVCGYCDFGYSGGFAGWGTHSGLLKSVNSAAPGDHRKTFQILTASTTPLRRRSVVTRGSMPAATSIAAGYRPSRHSTDAIARWIPSPTTVPLFRNRCGVPDCLINGAAQSRRRMDINGACCTRGTGLPLNDIDGQYLRHRRVATCSGSETIYGAGNRRPPRYWRPVALAGESGDGTSTTAAGAFHQSTSVVRRRVAFAHATRWYSVRQTFTGGGSDLRIKSERLPRGEDKRSGVVSFPDGTATSDVVLAGDTLDGCRIDIAFRQYRDLVDTATARR